MARQRTSDSGSRRSAVNLPLVAVTLVVLVIGGAVAFFVHEASVRRNAGTLLKHYQEAFDKAQFPEAEQWLLQYVQLRPDDHEARVLLAQVVDKSAQTVVAKARVIGLYNQAIGFFPGRLELPLRKAELLLEIGQYGEAVSDATQLAKISTGEEERARAQALKALGLYRQLCRAKNSVPTEEVISALKAALAGNAGHAELASALADVYRDPEFVEPVLSQEADAVMDAMVTQGGATAAAHLVRHRYRRKYDVSGADTDLHKALELAPNDVEVVLAQGDAQLEARAYPEAIASFRRILDGIDPHQRGAYLGLARAYVEQGNRRQGVEVCQQALAASGKNDLMLHLLLTRMLIEDIKDNATDDQTHRVEQSLEEVRAVVRRIASDLTENQFGRISDTVNTLEAEYWLTVGRPGKAAPLLAKAVESPRVSDSFRDDQEETARRRLLLGQAYAALQYWDLAADAYVSASRLQVNPAAKEKVKSATKEKTKSAVKEKVNPAATELAIAVALHNAGRLPQAIDRYHRVTQMKKVPAETWSLLARAEFQRQMKNRSHRDWTAFQQALQNAKRTSGPSAEVLLVEAEATAAQGATEAAVKILAQAVEANPAKILPMATLTYERWGFPDKADASLAQLRRVTGAQQLAEVVTTEAELLLRRKQTKEARRLLEESAATAQPREAARLNARLAELELSLGNSDAARYALRRSHQAQPLDPSPLQRLGDLAIQLRDVNSLKFCEQELKSVEGEDSSLWRFFRAIRLLLEHPEAGQPKPEKEAATLPPAEDVFAEVNELCQFLVRTRSNWPATHILLGIIAEREGKLDDAAIDYCRAADLGSQNITLYERLVTLLYTRNRAEDVAQYLDRLQDSLYSSTTLWSAQRSSLVQSGRFVELAEAAERAANVRKDRISQIWLGHARTLAAENEPDEAKKAEWYRQAEKAFDQATAGDGQKDFRTWAGMVWYQMRRKQFNKARTALEAMERHAELLEVDKSLALAQGYHLIGDIRQAEHWYNEAVKLSPRNTSVLERQAKFYFATNPAKAQEAFERLHKSNPGESAYRFMLAALWASSGEEADVRKAMELLSQDPATAGSPATTSQQLANRRLQAILLMQRGEEKNNVEAARLLTQLVEENADPADQLLLAQLHERLGKIQDAQRQYQNIVSKDVPLAAHLEAYLSFLLRHSLMEEFNRQMARLEAQASEKYGFRVARLKVQACKAEKRLGDIPSVVEGYRKAALARAKAKPQQAAVLVNVASLYDQCDLEPRAEQAFQELVAHELVEHAYRSYALWLAGKGRFADAVRLCSKHSASDPSAAGSTVLANVLAAAAGRAEPSKKGHDVPAADLSAAEQRIAVALEKAPEDRQLLFAVGALRHVQGRTTEAKQLYGRLVTQHASDVAGLNNLALILSEDPASREQALTLINQAIGQAPQSLELRDSLGLVLLNVGQPDKAQEVLDYVVARGKTNRRYLFHSAVANYRLGRLDAARRTLTQAKNLNLAEEVLTPSERQLLTRMEADLAKATPKSS